MSRQGWSFCILAVFIVGLSTVLFADATPADSCAGQYPGDTNSDGVIDSLDLDFLMDYFSYGGQPPNPLSNGDVNGDCYLTGGDYLFLGNYLAGGLAPATCTCESPVRAFCYWGDADGSFLRTISDAVAIISYIFGGGSTPAGACNSDLDCDCMITVSDAVVIINYIFAGGHVNENCNSIDDWLSHCAK